MKLSLAVGSLALAGFGVCTVFVPSVLARSPQPSISAHPRADSATVKLSLRGMTCGSCAKTAQLALQKVAGVYRATVSYDSATAVVVYDPAKTTPARFIARLKELTGYEASIVPQPTPRPPDA